MLTETDIAGATHRGWLMATAEEITAAIGDPDNFGRWARLLGDDETAVVIHSPEHRKGEVRWNVSGFDTRAVAHELYVVGLGGPKFFPHFMLPQEKKLSGLPYIPTPPIPLIPIPAQEVEAALDAKDRRIALLEQTVRALGGRP